MPHIVLQKLSPKATYTTLNGEALEEVDQFKYLGTVIAANGGVEAHQRHRVNEGCSVGCIERSNEEQRAKNEC